MKEHRLPGLIPGRGVIVAKYGDPEDPFDGLLIEPGFGVNQLVQAFQEVMQRCFQQFGPWREHHAMGIADQKIITEQMPETRKLRRERRLADAETPPRSGHAAFGKKNIQGDQEAEITALKIHFGYPAHNHY